jgi:hypothetical protein
MVGIGVEDWWHRGLAMKPFALIFLGVCVVTVGAGAVVAQEETKPSVSPQSAAQSSAEASTPGGQPSSQPAIQQVTLQATQEPVAAPARDKSKIVYVSDFELDAVNAEGKLEKGVPAIPPSTAAQLDPRREQGPVEQAGRLVDFMSATLVKELEKEGYSAHRLRPGETRPSDGIRISGIFGEPDEQNRLRRAVMGTFTADGKMSLFVGISNLARADQALYVAADPSGTDNKAGAVITVSSYAPVAKFEIEKNTTEKTVNDTATGIVADLSALLSANVVALTQ